MQDILMPRVLDESNARGIRTLISPTYFSSFTQVLALIQAKTMPFSFWSKKIFPSMEVL